ncbi:hypothetical protein HZF24_06995 [Sedimentibacter hydroxybenzoicus DSM 7310]|uniref:Uncharacterized protein n=1 Tax=Sedimentibacter hydroxybenzoicus DSM 7310 TaxID=1123245 RepID=A0A974GWB4_SEDHY|nr:hypothetical protein [Sedimentibacter hydroxybenzoicus]NYB73885.1 hypothetical protein [Sedimentibacter hydroxybenzoicus DSM 7310]
MTYNEFISINIDDLEEERDQLEEDINNVQTAIFRLQDIVNDSFEEIIKYSIEELEIHQRYLEREKSEKEERIGKYYEHLQ